MEVDLNWQANSKSSRQTSLINQSKALSSTSTSALKSCINYLLLPAAPMSTPVRTAHSYCVVVGLAVATLLGLRVPPLSSRLNNSLRSVSTLHY